MEAAFAAGQATQKQVAAARQQNWKALVEYASTSAGAQTLRNQWSQFGSPDDAGARLLQGAIDDGALLAQANRRAENDYRASQGKGPLATPLPLTFAQQAEVDEAARQTAEAEAARAADPLGLRAAQQSQAQQAQTQQIPVTPPAPQPAPQPVAQRPGLPTTRPGLPTRPPAGRTATATATRPAPQRTRTQRADAPTEREQRAEAARVERERKAAAAQAVREQRAAETRLNRLSSAESRKLKAEVSEEVKRMNSWMRETGTKKFTAPEHAWSGPEHWRGGTRQTFRDNRDALREGRARYGQTFTNAMRRYAGEYSASDVLSACQQLDAMGRDKISGRVRPDGWYSGYQTVDDHRVQSARQEAFSKAFGKQETDVMARQYVAANLEGVLWRARPNRPRQKPSAALAASVKKYLTRRMMR